MKQTKSILELAQKYLAQRRALGFVLRVESRHLLNFASFADRVQPEKPLTFKIAVQWARLPRQSSPCYHARRLAVVRRFALYCAAFDPQVEVPPANYLGPSSRRPQPHIYSASEIGRLLKTARQLKPLDSLRPKSFETLIGLLASTGLRLSEALRLEVTDVDLQNGVLAVRESKGGKSRLVPVHNSTLRRLRQFRRERDLHARGSSSVKFFLSENGHSVSTGAAQHTFRKLRVCLGIPNERPQARWHDFRHTFACHRLLLWCRSKHCDHHILWLSRYLGHRRVSDTYWYLTAIPKLFGRVVSHFEKYWQHRNDSPNEKPRNS
jgi:integrase